MGDVGIAILIADNKISVRNEKIVFDHLLPRESRIFFFSGDSIGGEL